LQAASFSCIGDFISFPAMTDRPAKVAKTDKDERQISVTCKHVPELDAAFVPAVLWNRSYIQHAKATAGSAPLTISLQRPDLTASSFRCPAVLPPDVDFSLTEVYIERIVKFLLWARGGSRIFVSGEHAAPVVEMLKRHYCVGGAREFDVNFVQKLFDEPPSFSVCADGDMPEEKVGDLPLGRHLDGNRIGFDLGGSDRKCAAVVDGKVVFSEEVRWDPYGEPDPTYHRKGIDHSLQLAAKAITDSGKKVDAIGGSSAGVYINNKVKVASLFRGVEKENPDRFHSEVKNMFTDIAAEWKVPFEVLNDGDVTALAASMSLKKNAIIGLAMGTSVAGGYTDPKGHLTNWLNELAFVPVDYRANGPEDEWSKDLGCGVQYFSQNGACRLLAAAGIDVDPSMKMPEKLVELQKLMKGDTPDTRAVKVYEAIGICFGYTLAHYHDFYDFSTLLIMGRVTSGPGGAIMIAKANQVLADEFPELSISVEQPSEQDKRHGQAIAAASLPAIS